MLIKYIKLTISIGSETIASMRALSLEFLKVGFGIFKPYFLDQNVDGRCIRGDVKPRIHVRNRATKIFDQSSITSNPAE